MLNLLKLILREESAKKIQDGFRLYLKQKIEKAE